MTLFCRAVIGETPDTEVTVRGLVEGRPYEFRVAAVNEAGPGKYAVTEDEIKPAPPPSKTLTINPFKPECTIVIFNHYKPRIAVAILDL